MLGDLDWHRFANGDFTYPVSVCRLRHDLTSILGASDDRLLIHPKISPKIIHKHLLTPWHISLIPIMVEFGTVLQDCRDGSLLFAYEDTVITGKMIVAAVRPTTERHEIWLRSLYPLRNKDYMRKLKRCMVISVQS